MDMLFITATDTKSHSLKAQHSQPQANTDHNAWPNYALTHSKPNSNGDTMLIHKPGNKLASACGPMKGFEATHPSHGRYSIFSFCVPHGSQGAYYRISMSREEAYELMKRLYTGLTTEL